MRLSAGRSEWCTGWFYYVLAGDLAGSRAGKTSEGDMVVYPMGVVWRNHGTSNRGWPYHKLLLRTKYRPPFDSSTPSARDAGRGPWLADYRRLTGQRSMPGRLVADSMTNCLLCTGGETRKGRFWKWAEGRESKQRAGSGKFCGILRSTTLRRVSWQQAPGYLWPRWRGTAREVPSGGGVAGGGTAPPGLPRDGRRYPCREVRLVNSRRRALPGAALSRFLQVPGSLAAAAALFIAGCLPAPAACLLAIQRCNSEQSTTSNST